MENVFRYFTDEEKEEKEAGENYEAENLFRYLTDEEKEEEEEEN